jgi:hypothetical protein
LESERERLERLEHDKEAVLKYYEEMAPEDLETRTPEERHRLYKMTRLEVLVPAEGPMEVSWACEFPTNSMPPFCGNGGFIEICSRKWKNTRNKDKGFPLRRRARGALRAGGSGLE